MQPTTAMQGSTIDIRLFVTNPRAVPLVGFEVDLPASATTYVPVAPDGWDVSIAGSTVHWEGGQLAPGATASFRVRVGPLPSVPSLSLPATQTFADGSSLRWDGSTGGGTAPAIRLTPGPTAAASTVLVAHPDHDGVASTVGTGITTPSTTFTDVAVIAVAATGAATAVGWGLIAGRRRRERLRRLTSESA